MARTRDGHDRPLARTAGIPRGDDAGDYLAQLYAALDHPSTAPDDPLRASWQDQRASLRRIIDELTADPLPTDPDLDAVIRTLAGLDDAAPTPTWAQPDHQGRYGALVSVGTWWALAEAHRGLRHQFDDARSEVVVWLSDGSRDWYVAAFTASPIPEDMVLPAHMLAYADHTSNHRRAVIAPSVITDPDRAHEYARLVSEGTSPADALATCSAERAKPERAGGSGRTPAAAATR